MDKHPEVVFDSGAIIQIKTFEGRLNFMDSMRFLKRYAQNFRRGGSEKRFFPVQVEQPAILGQSRSTA